MALNFCIHWSLFRTLLAIMSLCTSAGSISNTYNEIHEGHMNDDTRGQRSNSGNSLPGYKKEPRNPLHKHQAYRKLKTRKVLQSKIKIKLSLNSAWTHCYDSSHFFSASGHRGE